MQAILICEENLEKLEERKTSQMWRPIADAYFTSKTTWYYVTAVPHPFHDPHLQDTIYPKYFFDKLFSYNAEEVAKDWTTVVHQ
jgi:hypothetical protein